jgi:glycosyltransferase involved in cell wall biosynthesis
MSQTHKISIITPVLDAKDLLEQVIDTVRRQTYKNKQHIIIDGGSTDGTLETLKRNEGKITYWISEKDSGIYDGMNKGLNIADGEWFYFLGVDDVFYRDDTLESIFQNQTIPDDVTLILGIVLAPNRKLIKSRYGKSLYFKNTIHHQGAFYHRNLFEHFRYGFYGSRLKNRQFSISGDYQLNFSLFLKGTKCMQTNTIIARCGYGKSMQGKIDGYLEEILVRHQHISFFWAIPFDVLTVIRYLGKRFMNLLMD